VFLAADDSSHVTGMEGLLTTAPRGTAQTPSRICVGMPAKNKAYSAGPTSGPMPPRPHWSQPRQRYRGTPNYFEDHIMSKLNGKVAVITGGSSGIGLETAKLFVEEGAHVFITGRRQSELDKAKAYIGKNVTTVQGDVASLEDLDRLYQIVKDSKGQVDIVFANAGFVEHQTIDVVTPEHFDKTFNINVRGLLFSVQKALPLMTKGGSIILNSSIVSMKGLAAHGVYGATKAAVRSFARTWTTELKDRGIRVNTLSPGATDTPIIDGQFTSKAQSDAAKESFAAATPMGRIGHPRELANAALFLASDDSSFITGIDLQVDGGLVQV
jgi:NAD(P)-dependent dehydrogenase (short-subunit alcohol dehydrogenase family)